MRKIKWGIIGTANIAKNCTIPGMMEAENCERYAIAGRSLEKAKEYQKAYGFQKAYGTYDELLADSEVEAVYVALPNTLHYEWTIKALQSGKHVLCEKPLAPSAKQAQEMFDTAKANRVFLMEAFAYQHSPYLSAIKKEIDMGAIGEMKYMESAFMTSDYDISNIRMRKESLGGCTYDLGVYNTSLILRLFGEEPSKIEGFASFSPEGVDRFSSVLMEYPDGKKAAYTCGMILETNQDRRLDRFEIQGTKGIIRGEKFEFNGAGELSYQLVSFDGKVETKTVTVPQNYRLEIEQLGRCIAEAEMPAVTKEFSVANARMIDRILKVIGYE